MSAIDNILEPATIVTKSTAKPAQGLAEFGEHLREELIAWKQNSSSPSIEILRSDEGFNSRSLELMRLQFHSNQVFRRHCTARHVHPDAIKHWSEIPAIPTTAFKELEITSIPAMDRTAAFHSSGTTEQRPSRHFHHAHSLAIYEASLLAFFSYKVLNTRYGVPPSGGAIPKPPNGGTPYNASQKTMLLLTPDGVAAPHSSLVHMFESVCRTYGTDASRFVGKLDSDGSWILDVSSAIDALETASTTHQPLFVMGTAFSFVHLTDALAERSMKFQLPAGSAVMETGGYKGRSRSLPKQQLHNLIAEYLGIAENAIICEYGMSELSSQAYDVSVKRESGTVERQDRNGRLFQFPPWARVQIVSPETGREVSEGETGLIRIFDLANVYSALAIQTEDLGIRHGIGFELVGRAAKAEQRGCSLMAVE